MRRIYADRRTTGRSAFRGVLDEAEARDMVAGLITLEEDPHAVVVKFPDMWVIAQPYVLDRTGRPAGESVRMLQMSPAQSTTSRCS